MIGTIIVARSNSTRLPNKILININKNLKAIDILIKRAKKVGKPVILATTKLKSDNKLCTYVRRNYKKVSIFRGDNKNKIKRWYECFLKMKIQRAIIIDGDDIFFDYDLYKKQSVKIGKFDIISAPRNMITGLFTHILTIKGLKKMSKLFAKNIDSEMIEPFIKKAKLKRKFLKVKKKYLKKRIRLTLDYNEDLKLMREISKKFLPTCKSEKIVEFLLKNKDVAKINFFRENYWKTNQLNKIKRSVLNLKP